MMGEKSFLMLSLAAAMMAPAPAHADITIGISVETPPPIVATVPPLVVVPGSTVYYAPGAAFNLFVFGGRQYSFHNGVWFTSATGRGAWTVISPDRVPRPVLAVPVTYYKIPPGHARKMGGANDERGHVKGGGGGKARGKKGRGD